MEPIAHAFVLIVLVRITTGGSTVTSIALVIFVLGDISDGREGEGEGAEVGLCSWARRSGFSNSNSNSNSRAPEQWSR